MPITIWTKDKNSTSVFSALELDAGQYDITFDSNILTRNTVLLAAKQQQNTPIQVGGKVIKVTKATDDSKVIVVGLDVVKGNIPVVGGAGMGGATIYAMLGALGILAVLYVLKIEKTGAFADVGNAIGTGLAELLLKPGLLIVVIFGLLVFFWIKAKG